MAAEKLQVLKKELENKSVKELKEVILRLAKLKKENKEMLSYLLFLSDEPLQYAEDIKAELDLLIDDFRYSKNMKTLKKGLRMITKYARFTGSKHGEAELLSYLLHQSLEKISSKLSGKATFLVYARGMKKLNAIIPVLQEDLQYDYSREYNKIYDLLRAKISFWERLTFELEKIDV